MSTLNSLAKEIHMNAVEHGWWEEEPSFGEIVALCHSELSEALEEYRAGRSMEWSVPIVVNENPLEFESKPEGIAVEMADCLIRLLDWFGKEGLDVDRIVQEKMDYNKTRPYRHGNKKL